MNFFSCLPPVVDWASSCIVLRGNVFKASSGLDGSMGCLSSARSLSQLATSLPPFQWWLSMPSSGLQELVSSPWRATCPHSAFRSLCEDTHRWNAPLLLICLLFLEFPRHLLNCVASSGWGAWRSLAIQTREATGRGAWMFRDLIPMDLPRQVGAYGAWHVTRENAWEKGLWVECFPFLEAT